MIDPNAAASPATSPSTPEPASPGAPTRVRPGMRVRITQAVPRQSGTMVTVVEGEVVQAGRQKTGSWFAHTKDHKLWVDRVELRKADGELVYCNIDQYTTVEMVG